MIVDKRDPTALGEALLSLPRRGKLSGRYDRNRAALGRVARHTANPSCIEKYGSPVDKHKARIAVGLAVAW